jgi:hypothetical protein
MNDIKKLVTFGCSFTYGDELIDRMRRIDVNEYRNTHVWGRKIADHYGWEFDNQAFSGSSLMAIRDAVTWYVANNDTANTMFMVGLTASNRMSWINRFHHISRLDPGWNYHIHSSWVNGTHLEDTDWVDVYKSWVVDQNCKTLENLEYNETLLLIDGIASRYKIPTLQFNMLSHPKDLVPVKTHIMPDKIIAKIVKEEGKEREIVVTKDMGHPNEIGHEIISKYLIPYVDSVILSL